MEGLKREGGFHKVNNGCRCIIQTVVPWVVVNLLMFPYCEVELF